MQKKTFFDRLPYITAYTCKFDPRFSYFVYLPESYNTIDQPESYNTIVLIHGSERSAESYRNRFKLFAEETNSVIIVPLFPVGIPESGNIEADLGNYFMAVENGIRFDEILINMINEFWDRFNLKANKIMLHGFSGGAQFAHRFFYIHPERIKCISIGSMSMITYLFDTEKWPLGCMDIQNLYGVAFNIDKLKNKPIQIIVGDKDTSTVENTFGGKNRLEKTKSLFDDYMKNGLNVRYDIVEGVGHNGFKLLDKVFDFFRGSINMH